MRKVWLFSRAIDLFLLFLPVWVSWLVCWALPEEILNRSLPLWVWVVFILGIDVSHVWSTIFRTYLDKEEFRQHQRLLLLTPLLIFPVLFLIAGVSVIWFWRVLAYLALYHFIKQQYGFLALYKARHGFRHPKLFSDKWVIYFSMIYPVIYWHLSSQRRFNWFVDGDFFNLHATFSFAPNFFWMTHTLYCLILLSWLVEELYICWRSGVNVPWGKILWLLTTAGNWCIGIVYFNSDIAFSITNVIAHGVPYLVLVFYYVEKKQIIRRELTYYSPVKLLAHISFMLGIVLLLAFGEEYFWDLLLNRERQAFFGQVLTYPIKAFENPWAQAFAFALLSIPQVSHYIIDGFIWKGGEKNPYLKKVFLS